MLLDLNQRPNKNINGNAHKKLINIVHLETIYRLLRELDVIGFILGIIIRISLLLLLNLLIVIEEFNVIISNVLVESRDILEFLFETQQQCQIMDE